MTAREEHLPITRMARLFVIGEPGAVSDVWIVCHGYGQLAKSFVRSFEPIAASARLIVAPEGLHRFYVDPPPLPVAERRVGATWMTREDRETDIRDYIAYLDAVAAHFAGGTPRIRALGFSQGCATVFRWATLGSTRIDELILWTGDAPTETDMSRAGARLRDVRIRVVSGRRDATVPAAVVEQQVKRLQEAGLDAEVHTFAGGHELDAGVLDLIARG